MNDVANFPDDPALDPVKGFGPRVASVGWALGSIFLWLLFMVFLSNFTVLALRLQVVTLSDGHQAISGMGSDATITSVFQATSFLGALLAAAIVCARGRLTARDAGFRLEGVSRSLSVGVGLGLSLLTTVVLVLIGFGRVQLGPFDLHGLEGPLWLTGFAVLFGLVALTEELMMRGPLLTLFSRAFGFWPAAVHHLNDQVTAVADAP